MKIAIMQPTFNPWLGYFDLLDYVDKFIILDTVQLTKRSWQTRNKFKVQNKEYIFTIPVKKTINNNNSLIKDIDISYDNYDFRDKALKLIHHNYNKSKHYNNLISQIKKIILYKTNSIGDYNINFIKSISKLLGYKTTFVQLSKLDPIIGNKAELIYNIATQFNATTYVSPNSSKTYLYDYQKKFKENNIIVKYQNYCHPTYKQIGDNFISYLGILDLLLNEGLQNSKKIIQEGRHFNVVEKKVALLTSECQWFSPYMKILKNKIINSNIFFNHKDINESYDVVFILSYHSIIPKKYLLKHTHNIVIHASSLPLGKGWSPMFWQILEGKNIIPFTMIEASCDVDNGDIYMRRDLILTGYELNSELRKKQAELTINMCLDFLNNYNNYNQAIKQEGQDTFYEKRISDNSKLDINKSLKEQFNLLRIVDNEHYPAFFEIDGKRFTLKIEDEI